jgi:dienelactone hydrolase
MLRFFWFVFLLFLVASNAVSAEKLVSLDTREDVQQKFILVESENADASIILFAGGKGVLDLYKGVFGGVGMNSLKNNFLVRSRENFYKHGFNVATVDAPSDWQDDSGMLYGFRDSADHVQDIDAVIKYLKKQYNKPVWLIGTSRGTESVAYIAINTQARIDGVVFTSSMTSENNGGTSLPEMPLQNITVPVFITHHKNDGCWKTTPEGAKRIESMLTSAKAVELKLYEGGREDSNKPCKAMTHHGYLGIEKKVVDDIAAFIKKHNS